jgi:uncharacterized protein (TIGR02145 family)
MPASITKTLTVSVNSDGSVPFALLDGVYGIVGPVCLDAKVKKQPSTQSDEAFAARVDAFAGTANCTKTYRFIHSDTYSNLNLILLDPAGLVESMTPPASDGAIPVTDVDKEKAFTLTFKSDIKNRVPSDGDSLTVKLIATYINNNNIPKVAYLEIRIEDGICVCPAKVSDTEWLNFMCHNLGGPDIISSYQLITREHHGNWYRFGASRVSMENLEENDALRNWTTGSGAIPTYYAMETGYTGNISVWPDNLNANIANPCPAGWRLPLITELATVLNKNTANSDIAVINPLSNVPASWVPPGNQTFSNLKKSGDYLYLPAAGLREYLTGTLLDRGKEGYYWSSNGNMVNNAWWGRFDSGRQIVGYVNRSYGASVRCVEAE